MADQRNALRMANWHFYSKEFNYSPKNVFSEIAKKRSTFNVNRRDTPLDIFLQVVPEMLVKKIIHHGLFVHEGNLT